MATGPLLPGFTAFADEVGDPGSPGGAARISGRVGGSGPPVVLLHGYPQSGAMWHAVATALARERTVVVPDLRGYGASLMREEAPGSAVEAMSFRSMAADVLAVMARRGHGRFDVVGHDRGARTAHRLALDSPAAVRSVALLDILPTLAVWAEMDGWLARRYFHWTFLIQGGGLPERLIGADPLAWLHHAFGALGGTAGMHPEALAEYDAAALRPSVVRAWCADYRAAAGVDLAHDRADLGRALDLPTLVLWGEHGVVGARTDPIATWRAWFPQAVGGAVPTGHFLAEERPDLVLEALGPHLAAADALG